MEKDNKDEDNREEKTMRCPKCDFEQPDSSLECPHCGIIFERYYQAHYQAKEAEERDYIRKKSRMVRNAQIIVTILLVTILGLYIVARILLQLMGAGLEVGTLFPSQSVPELQGTRLSDNLLENGSFDDLAGWTELHSSNVQDTVSVKSETPYVIWERKRSRNDGGSVGVYQDLNLNVRTMSSLYLCFDVWVGYHTLKNTGWWAEERDGSGEMPVHVTVLYRDSGGQQQRWDHGFLLDNKAQKVLWLNPETGKREYKSGETTLRNVTPVLKDSWSHFCFDLLDSNTRKDVRRQQTLPRPATITRIMLYGNGWDFRGAVGNVSLRENK